MGRTLKLDDGTLQPREQHQQNKPSHSMVLFLSGCCSQNTCGSSFARSNGLTSSFPALSSAV
jgi:hypothetical protein